ncbi:adenylate/guanylate cyclase domain-containing protein [Bradyrhizobium manausense]|nr:adenylate/guanylate cyclase domain-containing protein [Bradyrhizobium manausense]MBR0832564.1 adenylate/guanylate cyclase domain-containing protein [Bradyrhizobium manausense]
MAGPVRIERRLSAILAADVSGYSRLMHEDEEGTHAKLMALLAGGVDPAIAEHGGRIVKNTGDGFLAEFASAVEAVRAAMQFQANVRELTTGDQENNRISFRVGINIGDIIVEPHDIFGDGVNIAARLESFATPGGICISSVVYEQVQGKFGDRFVDLGEQTFKNIGRPIRVYAILDELRPATLSHYDGSSALSPPRLSIVVLPLTNLSGDPEQDYFVDGVTGSLTTDLSRIGGTFVIGQHTAFTYKGKFIDIRQIGRELNVRYALEGSVQRWENLVRVNVQLIDAKTGNHLWADRFDKPVAGLLHMQDEIVSRIARTLDIQLIVAEAQRAGKTLNPDAMDLYFQGRHSLSKGLTSECLMEARRSFELALAIDPNNVDALSWMASVEAALGLLILTDHPHEHLTVSETTVLKSLRLAPDHPWAHFTFAMLLINTNRVAQGVAECQRALALDRNLADAHVLMGIAKFYRGCGADTESHVNEALRLSPRDIFAFHWMSTVGFAKLQIAADAEAAAWFARGIEANRNFPDLHFGYAAALALLGRLDEARAAAKTELAVDPTFTIRRVRSVPARGNEKFVAGAKRFVKGLYIAGVPDV